jgi:Flp pilus assembly protein TadB
MTALPPYGPGPPAVMGSRTYSAAFSYIGSTRRIIAATRRAVATSHPAVKVLVWAMAIVVLIVVWALVTCWYVVTFGLLWFVMIPWRIIRRGQRRNRHLMEQQTTLMRQMADRPPQ